MPKGTCVPIGWVAVGNPAKVFPPDMHDEIWAAQKELNFPECAYGVDRDNENQLFYSFKKR